MEEKYYKIRFTSKKRGSTAGPIFSRSQLTKMDIADVSRLFPYSEAFKMERLEKSPAFSTWEEAFNYTFPNKKK